MLPLAQPFLPAARLVEAVLRIEGLQKSAGDLQSGGWRVDNRPSRDHERASADPAGRVVLSVEPRRMGGIFGERVEDAGCRYG
jgi:hypothetical protein